jgi:hypothetical protein
MGNQGLLISPILTLHRVRKAPDVSGYVHTFLSLPEKARFRPGQAALKPGKRGRQVDLKRFKTSQPGAYSVQRSVADKKLLRQPFIK